MFSNINRENDDYHTTLTAKMATDCQCVCVCARARVCVYVLLLEGREWRRTSRLERTRDSEMLLTHSWLDVTVLTTWRTNTV